MNLSDVKDGMKVKTTKLEDITGMTIGAQHLECRKAGRTGVLRGFVPGHGGDVWWVQHDDNQSVGAYCFTEFEPA